MDPFAAIGFVSNIISFVDFGSKLVSKAHEIAESTDGALSANLNLELVTEDLRGLSDGLRDGSSRLGLLSPSDQKLEDLRCSCIEVADQLLDILGRLKIKHNKTKFKSFQQAVKIAWKKETLEELTRRLSMFRQQLDTHFLVELRQKFDRLAIQNSETYQKLNQRTQLIFETILANNTTVSDIAELQNERLESLRSAMLLHVDEQHNTTRLHIGTTADSIEALITEEHEQTRSRIQGIQEQGVQLRTELNDQIRTVLSETRGNSVGTANILHEKSEVVLEKLAGLEAQVAYLGTNLQSIATVASIQPQICLKTGNLSHTTSYILVRPDNTASFIIDNTSIEALINKSVQQQMPAAIAGSLEGAIKEGCLEAVADIRSSMVTSQQPFISESRSSPSFTQREPRQHHRLNKYSNLYGPSSQKFQDIPKALDRTKGFSQNSKRSKHLLLAKTKIKLQWKKCFETRWGSVVIRSDLLIKGKSSYIRFQFMLKPHPLFSRTILWSTFEKYHGSFSLSNYSIKTFNLRPDDAPFWTACSRYGDARTLRQMLLTGEGSPFDINEDGSTPLHYAIAGDRYDLCEILITHGAQMNVDFGKNPEILRLLLRNGACPLEVDMFGRDFWYPDSTRRSLTTEELQILIPYRGINERNDPAPNEYNVAIPLGIMNIYTASRWGNLTVRMLDEMVELGATFFHESTSGYYVRMNVHHLVIFGFYDKPTLTKRAVMVSVLSRLLQLYPDKHAKGPYHIEPGECYTTTCWASICNMLDIWFDALIESGEDIHEFLRADNELIQARGGGPRDFNYYCDKFAEVSHTHSEDLDYQTDTRDAYEDEDIFGAALRFQWGEDVLDPARAATMILFWISWCSLPQIMAIDAVDDIIGASLRSEWCEQALEVDWTSLLVLIWGSWNVVAWYVVCQRQY